MPYQASLPKARLAIHPVLLSTALTVCLSVPPCQAPLSFFQQSTGEAIALHTIDCVTHCTLPVVPDTELGIVDAEAIRMVIQDQLQAFRAGDEVRAFSHASIEIRKMYQTPAAFSAMVHKSYPPVTQPRAVIFEQPRSVLGIVTQTALLLAQSGDVVVACFQMEKQSNGEWKINGCVLGPLQ